MTKNKHPTDRAERLKINEQKKKKRKPKNEDLDSGDISRTDERSYS